MSASTYRYGVLRLGERRWGVIRWVEGQTGWEPIPIRPFKTRREAMAQAIAEQMTQGIR